VSVRIIHGDCRAILPTLEADSFDCVLTDPPYGETSLAWDRWPDGWPSLVLPLLKPSGSMWVFGSFRMFLERRDEFAGWKLSHEVVWEKHNGTGLFNDRFRRVHEIAAHFYPSSSKWADVFKSPQFTNDATARTVRKKGRPKQWIGATGETVYTSEDGGPRLMRSVLQVRSEHGRAIHPTQKPIGIVEPLLRFSCPVGGHVLDPFGGSGTTAISAKRCGMDATLIEGLQEFCDMAAERVRADAPLFSQAAE
jgi:site-specific DNA-methyltransferase (adenine-specific)